MRLRRGAVARARLLARRGLEARRGAPRRGLPHRGAARPRLRARRRVPTASAPAEIARHLDRHAGATSTGFEDHRLDQRVRRASWPATGAPRARWSSPSGRRAGAAGSGGSGCRRRALNLYAASSSGRRSRPPTRRSWRSRRPSRWRAALAAGDRARVAHQVAERRACSTAGRSPASSPRWTPRSIACLASSLGIGVNLNAPRARSRPSSVTTATVGHARDRPARRSRRLRRRSARRARGASMIASCRRASRAFARSGSPTPVSPAARSTIDGRRPTQRGHGARARRTSGDSCSTDRRSGAIMARSCAGGRSRVARRVRAHERRCCSPSTSATPTP